MPKISVIIPAYNAEKWLLKTIESVQHQTFSDFEIIVIDDGSTDSTLQITSRILERRLKVFSYEHSGVSAARNHGIVHSSGDFLAFLDADDLWTSDFLDLHLTALQQHPEADVAYCWTTLVDEEGRFVCFKPSVFFEGNVYPHLLGKSFLDCGSLLIRRQAIEFVGEFDTSLRFSEDWDYWVRLAHHSSFILIPKHQLHYRQWTGASSHQLDQLDQHEHAILTAVEKAFETAPIEFQRFKKKRLVDLSLRFARLYISYQLFVGCQSDIDGLRQARQRLQKAIRLEPLIVLRLKTLRVLVKWILVRTLSPKWYSWLKQWLSAAVYSAKHSGLQIN